MATSAARPNFQHYTAGSCTLEVEVQPSALSQWSARAIAKDLSFQLWLHDVAQGSVSESEETIAQSEAVADDSRQLIASGDRTDLQAIAQYFQQQTQQVLAIATINTRRRSTSLSSPPASLQTTPPLGYLQLCDITTVLGQYEQVVRTLPVALDAAPTVETVPDVIRAAPSDTSNVIPLSAARRQRSSGTDRRRQTVRRKRAGVWASSAAAALFAVGLTTTLLSRDPSLQETNMASDAVPEAQLEGSAFEESKPQAAAPEASEDTAAADSESGELPRGELPRGEVPRGEVPTGEVPTGEAPTSEVAGASVPRQSTAERNVRIEPTAESATGSQGPSATATSPPRQSASRAPVAADDASVAQVPESQSPEAARGTLSSEMSSESEPATTEPQPSAPPPPPVPAASDAEDGNLSSSLDLSSPDLPRPGLPSNTARRQPSRQSQPEAALSDLERERSETESVVPDAPVAAAPAVEGEDSDLASPPAPQAPPRIDRATEPFSPPPDLQPRTTVGGASRGDVLPPSPSARPAEALSGAIAPDTALTISQVQTYFQQRWQNIRQDSGPEPLAYRLQLNAAGEVISFIGLDDSSQAERDRILPVDRPPIFEPSAPSAPSAPSEDTVVLRVQLNLDGTVEVTPF